MGGSVQYVLWGGTDPNKAEPIEDFVCYIYFNEALVVSPAEWDHANELGPSADRIPAQWRVALARRGPPETGT